jgi:hypothetical protein
MKKSIFNLSGFLSRGFAPVYSSNRSGKFAWNYPKKRQNRAIQAIFNNIMIVYLRFVGL